MYDPSSAIWRFASSIRIFLPWSATRRRFAIRETTAPQSTTRRLVIAYYCVAAVHRCAARYAVCLSGDHADNLKKRSGVVDGESASALKRKAPRHESKRRFLSALPMRDPVGRVADDQLQSVARKFRIRSSLSPSMRARACKQTRSGPPPRWIQVAVSGGKHRHATQ